MQDLPSWPWTAHIPFQRRIIKPRQRANDETCSSGLSSLIAANVKWLARDTSSEVASSRFILVKLHVALVLAVVLRGVVNRLDTARRAPLYTDTFQKGRLRHWRRCFV